MTSPKSFDSPKSDFSIEHILNRAGNNKKSTTPPLEYPAPEELSWLQCTRYCPPKLPRNQKREGPQKRQLGRHPRIPFSSQQLSILEEKFKTSPYLSSSEVTQLSRTLQLADVRVKIWFQNRRARERRERNEQSTNQIPKPLPPQPYHIPDITTVIQTNELPDPHHIYSSHQIQEQMLQKLDFRNINCLVKQEQPS